MNILSFSLLPWAKAGCLVACYSRPLPTAFGSDHLPSPFCRSSTPVPASPASLQPPASAGRVGDASTGFAWSFLLLLPVPGCLQTYVLVPSNLNICVEQKGQSGWGRKRVLPGRACHQRRAIRVFTRCGAALSSCSSNIDSACKG